MAKTPSHRSCSTGWPAIWPSMADLKRLTRGIVLNNARPRQPLEQRQVPTNACSRSGTVSSAAAGDIAQMTTATRWRCPPTAKLDERRPHRRARRHRICSHSRPTFRSASPGDAVRGTTRPQKSLLEGAGTLGIGKPDDEARPLGGALVLVGRHVRTVASARRYMQRAGTGRRRTSRLCGRFDGGGVRFNREVEFAGCCDEQTNLGLHSLLPILSAGSIVESLVVTCRIAVNWILEDSHSVAKRTKAWATLEKSTRKRRR